MKKIIPILLTVMMISLTACGSKDDDVIETVVPEVSTPTSPPEPEPEPVLTYKDHFPATELIGQSLEEVSVNYEYSIDEYEGEIQKYVIDGTDVQDRFYNNIFLFTDENDIVTSIEYDFFFGNLYNDNVDLQIQETAQNLDSIYNLLIELGGAETTEENSLKTIAEDFESGKLFEPSYYNSRFDLSEIEVELENYMHVFPSGMIITKSITFDHGSVTNA